MGKGLRKYSSFRSNKKAASSLTLHVLAKLYVAHSHILFYLYKLKFTDTP